MLTIASYFLLFFLSDRAYASVSVASAYYGNFGFAKRYILCRIHFYISETETSRAHMVHESA